MIFDNVCVICVNQIQKTMSHFVGDVIQCSLEQDHMEGVEEHEWVDISILLLQFGSSIEPLYLSLI